MPTEEDIILTLASRGVKGECPRCDQTGQWNGSNDYFTIPMGSDPYHPQTGPGIVPVVILACDNCGFIAMHSAAVLGLVDPPPQPD